MSEFGRNDIWTSQANGNSTSSSSTSVRDIAQRSGGCAGTSAATRAGRDRARRLGSIGFCIAAPVSRSMTQLSTKMPITIRVAMALP